MGGAIPLGNDRYIHCLRNNGEYFGQISRPAYQSSWHDTGKHQPMDLLARAYFYHLTHLSSTTRRIRLAVWAIHLLLGL